MQRIITSKLIPSPPLVRRVSSLKTFFYSIINSLSYLYIFFTDGEEGDSYYTGRKLQSANHTGVAWEQCNFEKKNHKYVFLIPYIFLIFSLFIGTLVFHK